MHDTTLTCIYQVHFLLNFPDLNVNYCEIKCSQNARAQLLSGFGDSVRIAPNVPPHVVAPGTAGHYNQTGAFDCFFHIRSHSRTRYRTGCIYSGKLGRYFLRSRQNYIFHVFSRAVPFYLRGTISIFNEEIALAKAIGVGCPEYKYEMFFSRRSVLTQEYVGLDENGNDNVVFPLESIL